MQKFLAALVVILIVAGLAGYLLLSRQQREVLGAVGAEHQQSLDAQREDSARIARDVAVDLVGVLASAVADDVASGDLARLEQRLAASVQGRRLAGVLVLSPEGEVLSSTDLRFRGRTLDDPQTLLAARATEVGIAEQPPADGQIEIVAPLLAEGQRVGFLRAFVDLGDLAKGRE